MKTVSKESEESLGAMLDLKSNSRVGELDFVILCSDHRPSSIATKRPPLGIISLFRIEIVN